MRAVDALNIVALVIGGVGLIGGAVGVWVAMRTATGVAVKIVTATKTDTDALNALSARVTTLETWRADTERGPRPAGRDA